MKIHMYFKDSLFLGKNRKLWEKEKMLIIPLVLIISKIST